MMTLPASLVIFVVLIIVLAVLRSRLVYEVSGTSLLLFGSTRPGIVLYSFFFLLGTIIHELSHWLVAEILQVKTGAITIFPDLDIGGESQRLGSVATAKSDPFRGFLIGVAPFVTGVGILLILGRLLILGWDNFSWWSLALIVYGIIVVGNSMIISKEDRRTWPFIILFFALITIFLVRSQFALSPSSAAYLAQIFASLNLVLGVTAAINLVMIGGSYLTRRIVERATNRRIIRK